MLNILITFFLFITSFASVSIVGPVKFDDGIFRLSIIFIDMLKDDLEIDFISTGYVCLDNISDDVKSIISNSDKKINKKESDVGVFLSSPWTLGCYHSKYMPNNKIKIAYSMIESDEIPQEWVTEFNNKFDAIVVPDEFLVEVYQKSGIKKPIFVLPCGLYLKDFLNQPLKNKKNNLFRFGCSATFSEDKNQMLLLKAFANCFSNDINVELYLHGRGGDESNLLKFIKDNEIKNVKINKESLSHQEYLKMFNSFDCYVLISKGEGFSITPREAMALGIPCILSNNTAHKTICKTGLLESVDSSIVESSYYSIFGKHVGNKFNCKVEDVSASLINVYNNYQEKLNKSDKLRQWVLQFEYTNLKKTYLTLVKPNKIILGNVNSLDNGCLTTDSKELFDKYQIINKTNKGTHND